MIGWLFDNGLAWYSIPAIVGTVFFVLRMALMMAGGIADTDLIPDIDADADIDPDIGDSTAAFEVLSLQSLAAFAMGFGWGGFASIQSGLTESFMLASVIGVAIGIGMVWLFAVMIKAVYGLQSSGNVSIRDAVGREGDVYAGVPANGEGLGRVRMVINNQQRYFNARTSGDALERSARVRVTGVSDNTLTVERA